MVAKVLSEFGFPLADGDLFWFNDCDVALFSLVSVFGWLVVVLRGFWLGLGACLCIPFSGVCEVFMFCGLSGCFGFGGCGLMWRVFV